MKGCIHIYEGDGKGKSTAAIGLAVRCAGSGQKVLFTQFLKGNNSSEISSLERLPNIIVYQNSKEFGFSFHMDSMTQAQAKIYYRDHFREAIFFAKRENVRLLILDELLDVYNLNMVDRDEVLQFLRSKPEEMEVVLTGRNPDQKLLMYADYVTRMQKVKHPYDWGLTARKGIEM